jgi:uncharacterized protein (UPF0332 family)
MDKDMAEAVLEQAFTLWFNPEIDRRRAAGTLPDDFTLWAAQVVMVADDQENVIRLNDEVRIETLAVSARAIDPGSLVSLTTESDLNEIVEVSLSDADPNSGHCTILRRGEAWLLSFDFRYNATRIQNLLSKADQFLEAARLCVENGLPAAAVDTLYDAVEMMAKCFLLISPDPAVLTSQKHTFIESRFHQQRRLDNVSDRSARLVKRLAKLRPEARYNFEPVVLTATELDELLNDAIEMKAEIESRRPKRR